MAVLQVLSGDACFVADTCLADTCFVACAGPCAARSALDSLSGREVVVYTWGVCTVVPNMWQASMCRDCLCPLANPPTTSQLRSGWQ